MAKLLNILLYLSVFIVLIGVFVFAHENTHKYIAEHAGCNATMHLNPFSGINRKHNSLGYTTWKCNISTDKYSRLKTQEINVDAVGFQIFPLYVITICILIGKKHQSRAR